MFLWTIEFQFVFIKLVAHLRELEYWLLYCGQKNMGGTVLHQKCLSSTFVYDVGINIIKRCVPAPPFKISQEN